MTPVRFTPLEPRSAPVAFDVSFDADPWFTPERRSVVVVAFSQWAVVADPLPPLGCRCGG